MYDSNYLAKRIASASEGQGDALFIEHGITGERLSYSDFWVGAERMAAVLVEAGVQPGDRVAVQAPKTQAMLELYVGTVLAGGVFLPLNTAYTGAELSYFLGDASPRVLVCDPRKLGDLTPIAAKAGVAEVLTIAGYETGTLIEKRDAKEPGFTPVARGAHDLAAILYTSGTTGRPKGAPPMAPFC